MPLKSLAQEYYRNLSEQDRRFMDVSRMRCTFVLQYYRADKLVAELTKTRTWESVTRRPKVIGIQQVSWIQEAEAENVLALAQAEKADFGAIAAKYSKDSHLQTGHWNGKRTWTALKRAALSWSRTRSAGFWSRAEDIHILKV